MKKKLFAGAVLAHDRQTGTNCMFPYWITAIDMDQAIGIALKAAQNGPFKGDRFSNLKPGLVEVSEEALAQVQ